MNVYEHYYLYTGLLLHVKEGNSPDNFYLCENFRYLYSLIN